MQVSCSACSAKFQLPDDKIAGRRARMKCKRCGAAITIDGTSVRPSAPAEATAAATESPATIPPVSPPAPLRAGAGPRPLPPRPTTRLPAREKLPSYSDQTVALGAAEAAALSRHSLEVEDDHALDAQNQRAFSHPAPPPRALPARPDGAAADRSRSFESEDEATRMFDLASSSKHPLRVSPRSDETEADEPTRVFDAEAGPVPPLALAQPGAAQFEVPRRPAEPYAELQATTEQTLPPLGPAEGGAYPDSLTLQRQSISTLPPGTSSVWGLYLFGISLILSGALVSLYIFQRELFERGIAEARQVLGVTEAAPIAEGPPFDAAAAGDALLRIGAQVDQCRRADGPTGAGRARVLFQPSGSASSAAVSPPFHGTQAGECLVELFRLARVPSFGGQAVIVTKTFRVPQP